MVNSQAEDESDSSTGRAPAIRRLPSLTGLRAFEAVARHRSFAQAAAELHVTSTAITHAVRKLEAEVGRTLLRRRPRPIALTAAGELLYPVLRDGFDRLAQTIDRLGEGGERPAIRIATTPAFASRWLLPRMRRIEAELGCLLAIEASERPADLRRDGIDLALRYHPGVPAFDGAHELFRDRFIAVASPAFLAGHPVAAARDLSPDKLIHFRWHRADLAPPGWPDLLDRAGARDAGAAARTGGLRFSDEDHAIEAAVRGLGVALVSEMLAAALIEAGELVTPFDASLPGWRYWAIPGPRGGCDLDRLVAWIESELHTTRRP